MQAKRLAIVELRLALVALEDQGLAMNLLKMVHKCPVVLVVLVADNAEEVALRGSLVVELDLIIALATGGGAAAERLVALKIGRYPGVSLGTQMTWRKSYVT